MILFGGEGDKKDEIRDWLMETTDMGIPILGMNLWPPETIPDTLSLSPTC